uniref:Glutathione peroxidase 3 n=1 Tax=Homo sapiens TaxID=9606 RepID=A0A182DWI0_HUMAN
MARLLQASCLLSLLLAGFVSQSRGQEKSKAPRQMGNPQVRETSCTPFAAPSAAGTPPPTVVVS